MYVWGSLDKACISEWLERYVTLLEMLFGCFFLPRNFLRREPFLSGWAAGGFSFFWSAVTKILLTDQAVEAAEIF